MGNGVSYSQLPTTTGSSHGPSGTGAMRLSRQLIVTLAIGMTFGFCFAYMLLYTSSNYSGYLSASDLHPLRRAHHPAYHNSHDESHDESHGHDGSLRDAHSDEEMDDVEGPAGPVSFHSHDEHIHRGKSIFDQLITNGSCLMDSLFMMSSLQIFRWESSRTGNCSESSSSLLGYD